MIKINDRVIVPHYFPDGTFNLNGHDFRDMVASMKYPAVTITWFFESLEEQVLLSTLTLFLQDKMRAEVDLVMPYVPNARMDRVKNPEREVHTLKYFAHFINSLNFTKVCILDPHSAAAADYIDRTVVWGISKIVKPIIVGAYESDREGFDFLYFPDKGAYERYSDTLNIRPALFGEKDRDWATGEIRGLNVRSIYPSPEEGLAGKRILMIDDISSYGGTFKFGAMKLREMGFETVCLYVTHCENSIMSDKGVLTTHPDLIDRVYTTDSLYRPDHDKITTIPLNY